VRNRDRARATFANVARSNPDEQWWLQPDERILHHARTSAKYQYVDSMVRKGFPGMFFVTDRRFVASNNRAAKKRRLPMDVPLDRLQDVQVVNVVKVRRSSYRAWFGKRLLRLDIDHKGRHLVIAVVLPEAEANRWAETLGERPTD